MSTRGGIMFEISFKVEKIWYSMQHSSSASVLCKTKVKIEFRDRWWSSGGASATNEILSAFKSSNSAILSLQLSRLSSSSLEVYKIDLKGLLLTFGTKTNYPLCFSTRLTDRTSRLQPRPTSTARWRPDYPSVHFTKPNIAQIQFSKVA